MSGGPAPGSCARVWTEDEALPAVETGIDRPTSNLATDQPGSPEVWLELVGEHVAREPPVVLRAPRVWHWLRHELHCAGLNGSHPVRGRGQSDGQSRWCSIGGPRRLRAVYVVDEAWSIL